MPNQPKYYLISYYARLPNGGFGFSRTYYAVNAEKEFDIEEFELAMALESGLTVSDIALISRITVSVEEYNHNQSKVTQEILEKHGQNDLFDKEEGEPIKLANYDCPGLHKMEHKNGPHGDENA